MPADSVIQGFEPFEHVLPGFCTGPIALMIHVFRVQSMKETFHDHIVPAVLAPTHARRQTVTGQQIAVPAGGVLGPTVRMMHHAGHRWVTAMVSAAIAVRRRLATMTVKRSGMQTVSVTLVRGENWLLIKSVIGPNVMGI